MITYAILLWISLNLFLGKPIKCLRGELATILECFKIQINNPVSVLNQEMAKSFIKTSNPKDLYKFFMKGTFLSELEESIRESKEVSLPQLARTLQQKTDVISILSQTDLFYILPLSFF